MSDTPVRVRTVERTDAAAWLQMRHALWPEGSVEEHAIEIERFLSGQAREPMAVLIAEDPSGRLLGFAELSIRSFAEDCATDRVAFLEGWYVAPESRRQGVGGRLVAASEGWARTQGCTEFASDAVVDDAVSIAAHKALGFADAGRLQCFRKDL
jgi:aminoglycoside 6'-N-acetyltransferase I